MNNADAFPINESQHLAVLRAIFDNSPDLVYAINSQLQVVACNATFHQLCANDNPEGMTLQELGFNATAIAEHQIAFGADANGESWCPNIDVIMNRQHFSNCTVIPVPPFLIFHLRDSLAQRSASRPNPIRRGLFLSPDLFTRIAEDSADLLASVDTELRYVSFNAAFQNEARRMYGQEIKLGDSVAELTRNFPEHQDLLEQSFERALCDETIHHTVEIEGRAGPRFLDLRFYPLRDENGKTVGAGQIALDISDQMTAEAALRDSERRFRTLADNISQLVWMVDAKAKGLWFNKRWQEFTDVTLDRLNVQNWRLLVHPDHLTRVQERLQKALDTGEVWEDVFPMKGKKGSYRWFLSRAVPIPDSEGRILHWFGTHTDITDQRAAEEALRQADHNKDRFLATLAHELRNPMAPLRSALETLRLTEQARAAQHERNGHSQLYDMMNRQVDQLVRLIDDLLEVSRLTRGEIKLRKERIDLVDVVRSALETAEPLVQAAGHRLHVSMPGTDISFFGDSLRLTQALSNLLNNAAKYTEAGGDIWLTVSERYRDDRPHAVVSVKDSGRGIEPLALPYIFDSFVQLANDEQRTDGGLGIGLSIVRTLVRLHGGTVEANSPGADQGAEFIVSLPMEHRESDHEPDRREWIDASAGTSRTLIVDDNVDAARSLGDLLTLLGNEVCVVHNGPAALAVLDDFDPALILLDIDMPDMDGYEVARRLRRRPDIDQRRLVALTGFGQAEDRRRAMAAGFDQHLVKPVDLATLRSLYATPSA